MVTGLGVHISNGNFQTVINMRQNHDQITINEKL